MKNRLKLAYGVVACATALAAFAQSPAHDALKKEIAELQKKPVVFELPPYLPPEQDFADVCRDAGEKKKKLLVSIGREACGRCQRFYELVRRGDVKIDTNAFVFVRLDIDEYTQRDYFMDAFDPPDGQLPFVGVTDAERSTQRPCLTGYRTPKEYQALVMDATPASCPTADAAADDVRMPSICTVPHELDCLLKAGHIQGACCSEKAIYLSHQLGICKIGWDGKLIRSVEAPAHLGDTAYADGKIYGAFVIRSKALRKDGKKGLVRVWDEDFNLLREAWFDEALDGITVIGDTVYVGVDRWGHDKHDGCCIKRLTTDLTDLGNVDLDLGYQIHFGVQTMATDGKDLFLGCYGGTSRVSKDLKTVTKVKLACSEGFDLVPKSISKYDTPVFFVVKALGGNMHGWRKDPVNNPPRIRIDFHAYSNGAFKD